MRSFILSAAAMAGLIALAACSDLGKPMAFPVPESELGPRPGVFTGPTGEWVVYRKQ